MVIKVNTHEAKSQLSRLITQSLAGEEVIVMRAGKPVVRIVPVRQRRAPGSARGRIWMSPDFDEPLPDEILDSFESG
jgi:prevent-host-death family protein